MYVHSTSRSALSSVVCQHAAGQVHHIGEPRSGEQLRRHSASPTTSAENDDPATLVELAHPVRQLTKRNVDGSWERAGTDLVGLSDIDELTVATNGDRVVGDWMIGMRHDHTAF